MMTLFQAISGASEEQKSDVSETETVSETSDFYSAAGCQVLPPWKCPSSEADS